MDFIEIKVRFSETDPWKDLYAALLAEVGFDSFCDGEDENELCGYVREDNYDAEGTKQVFENQEYPVKIEYTLGKVESQDWNAVWESNYEPVQIKDCYIRAPFHPSIPEVKYEILIEPKMSFGTAHHETTSMMIEYLLEEEIAGKRVLDMGSGTGILAILSHKRGAASVVAIDNDEWAYRNNLENNEKNHTTDIDVRLGDATALRDEDFDIVIANINRNILLNDIPAYAKTMHKGTILFLSGFYADVDLPIITDKCKENGLKLVSFKEKNRWCGAKFVFVNQ
ncbi:MAG: 50S ribosomal protein L11 methyltransferase [Bacteroidales bacterium]|nr:50S ribosomal protein L11 methyltransferase [Bacteroidales bacterium]